ncbi:DUF3237 family protein [Maritimibacter sp. DP07]|uniref:UPF0311 protein GQE99_01365 n=1 Tax=Maritimibacter harenae TaxID=2606218 RepID=A0A845LY29_9RHOB|nr:DUF3237 domain-containing protein [Maritimibacter harenae]MZR11672.1 DUF3237 family protein [Maritimibacter harenae]
MTTSMPHDLRAPGLEFIFRMTIFMKERQRFGPGPAGVGRGFTGIDHGEITGPRLTGRVLGGTGGDYPLFRRDETVNLNAHYVLQAEDGTYIYINNMGYRHATADVNERLRANEVLDPSEYYFRLHPIFDAPEGPHDWLTRTVVIGTADRREDHTIFDYFAVT